MFFELFAVAVAMALQEHATRPCNPSNVVAALREEDYSFRARNAVPKMLSASCRSK